MIFLGKYKLIHSMITICDYEYVLNKIEKRKKEKRSYFVSPIASYTLVRAWEDKKLMDVLNKFDDLVPDSQWIRYSLKFLYGIQGTKRVYGPDLMLNVCKLSTQKRFKIFLYGNKAATLNLLKKRLYHLYPGINIVAAIPSKFRELTSTEIDKLQRTITVCNPDVIFVSLGSPLQEIFTVEVLGKIKSKKSMIILPVGAAFDFISLVKPQAPRIIQDFGFEWLYRLLSEPFRLWKRYLIYGPLFLGLVVYQKIKFTQ